MQKKTKIIHTSNEMLFDAKNMLKVYIFFDCPLSTNPDDECGNEYATDLRHNT